ncbi:hypothetical protein [Desulfotomaculum sp. 1211_IL3151]|uniref:hypothetical protein n=1 Tax=Desulfotomaculum sp. 1211_IL3151 TaxID=3084055 RepID=UPI002FDAEE55
MYKFKRITMSLLLVMFMFMAFCVPSMASDDVLGTSIEVPVITVDEDTDNVNTEKDSSTEVSITTVDKNSNNVNSSKESSSDGIISPHQDVSIPTNVSAVKVTSTGFQGYRLTPSPGWLSFSELNDTATIN